MSAYAEENLASTTVTSILRPDMTSLISSAMGPNVIDAADNDPGTLLSLDTNDATQFPRYIRQESSDAWDLEEIGITLNPGQSSEVVLNALVGPNQHLVLGGTTGKVLYL
jgi:hypothetical protein